jgi:hypothetical protein
MSDNAVEANPTRVSRGFFAIDRGAFRCAAVGGLNAAVPSGDGPSASRRDDVLAFYGDGAAVSPLAFSSTIKDMKGLLHNG